MGVMLQAFYRLGTAGVPSPADGGASVPWWWDHLAAQAHAFRDVGFSAVWLPPPFKGASGTQSIGYDVYDDYDLGAKAQQGTKPTRYGSRDQLTRCAATMHACGLDVYVDLVENQRSGGINFRYRYRDANGGDGGRFPKNPDDFHPQVPQDPGVFGGPRIREVTFGDDLAVINGKPHGHLAQALVDAAGWLTRALDVQGYRLDDTKGFSTQFVPRLLDSPMLARKFAVGEFFDGNVDLLRRWINDTGRRAATFDFPLRFALARMCNQTGSFDMGGSLDHAGLAGVDPMLAVTFVENHDTDTRPELQPIIANKMLAYAYILTSEGYPCVFYRDYSHDQGCYGLKPLIDNLIWIHEKLADGPTVQRWKEIGLFAYERLGGPRLLVALNKDDWQSRTITVDTSFGPGALLHDYSGHSGNARTDGAGRVTITVPRNRDGLGYVCYSRDGLGSGFELNSRDATQEFEGAPDLDVGPAGTVAPTVAGRVWAEKGRAISVKLSRVTASAALTVFLHDPDAALIASHRFTRAGEPALHVTTAKRGWHRLLVQAESTPTNGAAASYALAVTYAAPANVSQAELSNNP
jgi:alpha-amylase